MKQDFERVKEDVETIQKALGLASSFALEWVQWMKRDQWFSLWWCAPGMVLIAAALLPLANARKYLGLRPVQWIGILAASVLFAIAAVLTRRATGKDGRPEGLARETRRTFGMTRQGFWFGAVTIAQMIAYFAWGRHYHIAFKPFWTGLFLLWGFTCLTAALAARVWILLGYAIPFLAYGFCQPLVEGFPKAGGTLLGMMFIAIGLSFTLIQAFQIRQIERQHESH